MTRGRVVRPDMLRALALATLVFTAPVSARAVGHERIPLDSWSYDAVERFETLAADLAWAKREWFFTVQPEADVLIGRDTSYASFGLNLSVRYTWLPATFGDVTNLQALTGAIGLYSLF